MRKTLLPAAILSIFAIGCSHNKPTISEENANIVEDNQINIIQSVTDSLISVYPNFSENPIQKSDFLASFGNFLQTLSEANVSEIPFELYQIQNEPNQPGNKYLVAFEYKEICQNHVDFKIHLYAFAAFDKETASQLKEKVKYKISGTPKSEEMPPALGGWHNDEIIGGIKIENASISEF